ncbi:MAG: DMT family transporter [Desulfobacterales bacterium]|nr:DMT family transporter [Desulfobacterales bacterium]MCP4161603.1 DMT family transporter [Deltaproteobacteria bacterium]
MQNSLIGFILAIVSMVGLGVSSFLYKQSTTAIGPVNTTFFYYLFSVVFASVAWIFFKEEGFASKELLWPFLTAVFLFISVLTFNFAIKYIDVSIGATIRSLSFIVTVVLAVLIFKEKLYLKDYIALTLAIVAIVIFGMNNSR